MNTLTTSNLSKIAINKSKISLINYDESADCISREQAKQFLYERIDRLNDDELYDIFSRIIDDMYNELPSVQPTRPTGKWIKMPLIEAGQTYSHECSLCGRRILITDVGLSEFPYCHCGAKMEEVEE